MKKVNELSEEYILSANQIATKLDELRNIQVTLKISQQRDLDERINVLETQYHYLLQIATYLKNYYKPIK